MTGNDQPRNRVPAFAALALVMIAPMAAQAAIIEAQETRPKRPLVIEDGASDLYVGLGMSVTGDPEFDVASIMHVPIGADFGLRDRFELGGRIDLALKPEVAAAFTLRGRVDLGLPRRMLALGLSTTLPLGSLSDRLGPEKAVPLTFEIPAFRLDGATAAFQAELRWNWTIQSGPDAKSLDIVGAGIFRINQEAFAHLDFGAVAPDFKTDGGALLAGLGLGYAITPNFIGKIQAYCTDLGAFNPWEVMILIVNTSPGKAHSGSEWN